MLRGFRERPPIRILALYPYALGPDRLGGLIRARLWLAHLARAHAVTLVEILPPDEGGRGADSDPVLAGLAARRRIRVAASGRGGAVRALLARRPPAAMFLGQEGATREVADLIRAERPDAAFVEFSLLAEYGRLFRELRVPAVLAEQELPSRRFEREWKGTFDPQRAVIARMLSRLWRDYEAASLRRFADLWLISPEEQAYAAERLRLVDTHLFPNVVDPAAFPPVSAPPAPLRAAFFGNFRHRPNVDGLRWLLREAWPKVRARAPEAALRIYGRDAEPEVVAEIARAGAEWKGFAPDLTAAMAESGALLCPMVSGGGMRGKVLEALAAARPVVATPIGAEGVEVKEGLRVASEPRDFAEALLALWADPEGAAAEALRAAEAVRARYGAGGVFAQAEERLASLLRWRERA